MSRDWRGFLTVSAPLSARSVRPIAAGGLRSLSSSPRTCDGAVVLAPRAKTSVHICLQTAQRHCGFFFRVSSSSVVYHGPPRPSAGLSVSGGLTGQVGTLIQDQVQQTNFKAEFLVPESEYVHLDLSSYVREEKKGHY